MNNFARLSRTFFSITVFALAFNCIGCDQRRLAPELEYRGENVRMIREGLEMPVDSIPVDHINADADVTPSTKAVEESDKDDS